MDRRSVRGAEEKVGRRSTGCDVIQSFGILQEKYFYWRLH